MPTSFPSLPTFKAAAQHAFHDQLRFPTAARKLGINELVDALQRGIRQAAGLLDGRWAAIPRLWWCRFDVNVDWQGSRVKFAVDGRLVEFTDIVIDCPPLLSEERKGLVEATARRYRVQEMAEAIKLADQSAKTVDQAAKKQLFDAWWEKEMAIWGSCPPVEASKDDRETVRRWAQRNGLPRDVAEGWAREKAPVKRGRRPSKKPDN